MEGGSSRLSRKRPFFEDDDKSNDASAEKKVRFPKGKKLKQGDEAFNETFAEEAPTKSAGKAHLAAKRRLANRLHQTSQLLLGEEDSEGDETAAEIAYDDDNDNFVEDGIQIEPFNLNKEREEGYFDADGNFVEYVLAKEDKDAWLDSIDVDPRSAAITSVVKDDDTVILELTSDDVREIKRRIANFLQPGETVLQALRRLKGTSSDRKAKMSAETKIIFDQLTEDAMKLLENGEYDVYNDRQEVFQREAHVSAAEVSDAYDMFGEDEVGAAAMPSTDMVPDLASTIVTEQESMKSDYEYDESSGYYYSASLGYYYDSSTGLYCAASTGTWYSFNDQTGTYEAIKEVASSSN